MTEQEGTQPAGGWQPQGAPPPPPPPAPPVQPAWPPPPVGAAPPVQPAWPPAAAARSGPSTSLLVVLSAIFLLIVGLLTLGMGLLLMLGGALFAGLEGAAELEGVIGSDLFGAFGGIIAGVAVIVVLWALLEIFASIGMFAHRGWGRAIGLIVGILGVAFTGLSLVSAVGAAGDGAGASLGFLLVFVAGYGLTVLALVTGGAHFRRA